MLGLALLSPGLALMIYGLAKSASSGGFGAPEVWAPALIGAALIVAFVFHGLRTPHALIDLGLFKNRTFAVASGTLMLMIISVFGAMLLLPLYLQAVRGESALDSGLLLAPQGIGAMIAMPIAGQLTDKTGVGKIVIPGLVVLLASTIGLTQLTGDTSYWALGGVLFVMGIGMGFSMMPLMSGAMQTLRRIQVARASTTLNIIQQVGASIGTAVMSVVLTVALQDKLGGAAAASDTGLGATGADLPLQVRNLMTEAFTHTYWWAVALIIPAMPSRSCCRASSPSRSRTTSRAPTRRRPCSCTLCRATARRTAPSRSPRRPEDGRLHERERLRVDRSRDARLAVDPEVGVEEAGPRAAAGLRAARDVVDVEQQPEAELVVRAGHEVGARAGVGGRDLLREVQARRSGSRRPRRPSRARGSARRRACRCAAACAGSAGSRAAVE